MPRRTLITLVVLALLAGGAYLGYPRAHAWWAARSVPADLRAYVDGQGVRDAPPGEGYSVRLPKAPVRADATFSRDDGPWAVVHRSVVTGADYQIAVRVAELSDGATLPFGVVGALVDQRVTGGVVAAHVRKVTFDGRPAYDYDAPGESPLRGRIFRRGPRVYVVTVRSEDADRVFDALMRSFTPAG